MEEQTVNHLSENCTCTGKRCNQCDKVQCIEGFHRYSRSPDGRRSLCKVCRKTEYTSEEFKAKRREHHKENADHINETKRAWAHANPERVSQHSKASRSRHPARVKAYEQEYNRSERGKERDKKYRSANPEKVKETQQKSWYKHHNQRIAEMRTYHARMRTLQTGAGGAFTVAEWELLKAQYDYTCPGCGRKEPEISLTVDHKRPVSQLGSSHIENIQPLCLSCNSRKGTKVIDYREEQKDCG